jgi:hypothetical protein
VSQISWRTTVAHHPTEDNDGRAALPNLTLMDQEPRFARPPPPSASSPDCTSLLRPLGAVLAEQHDEWTEQRRYLGLDILAKRRLTKITNAHPQTRR